MTSANDLDNGRETVLVTGGSGFLGLRCVAEALTAGYQVRTTVRSVQREVHVREMVAAAGALAGDMLSVVPADLTADTGWAQAVTGCDFVLHVASPFPSGPPEHEDDLIIPAREGTLRVLQAARDASVRRVVVTSSFAAIGYGHPPTDHVYTEDDWTNPNSDVAPYITSKTLAERAAWEFIHREADGLELAVINPVAIFGPVLGPDHSTSIGVIKALLGGAMQHGAPRLSFAVVDVRDAADLHLRAMTHPAAAGQRYICSAGDSISMHHIAHVLREHLGDAARLAPTETLPDEAVREAARHNPMMQATVNDLGNIRHLTNDKARHVLGWTPRSSEEAIIATADSLIRLGLLPGF